MDERADAPTCEREVQDAGVRAAGNKNVVLAEPKNGGKYGNAIMHLLMFFSISYCMSQFLRLGLGDGFQ